MLFFALLAPVVLLAGQALGQNLNVTFGRPPSALPPSQMIFLPPGDLQTTCQDKCNPAIASFQACGDSNNIVCLCTNATMQQFYDCQQCMFTKLIQLNKPMPDPRAGSTPLMAAFSGACGNNNVANVTVPALPLVLPDNWNGPYNVILGTPATIVTVAFGGFLGAGALYILSNI